MLNDLELTMKLIEFGVVPAAPNITKTHPKSVLTTLNKLDGTDGRIAKRKFRKL